MFIFLWRCPDFPCSTNCFAFITGKYLALSKAGLAQSERIRSTRNLRCSIFIRAVSSWPTHLDLGWDPPPFRPRRDLLSICERTSTWLSYSGRSILAPSDAIKHSISLYQVLTTINAWGAECFWWMAMVMADLMQASPKFPIPLPLPNPRIRNHPMWQLSGVVLRNWFATWTRILTFTFTPPKSDPTPRQ